MGAVSKWSDIFRAHGIDIHSLDAAQINYRLNAAKETLQKIRKSVADGLLVKIHNKSADSLDQVLKIMKEQITDKEE